MLHQYIDYIMSWMDFEVTCEKSTNKKLVLNNLLKCLNWNLTLRENKSGKLFKKQGYKPYVEPSDSDWQDLVAQTLLQIIFHWFTWSNRIKRQAVRMNLVILIAWDIDMGLRIVSGRVV